MEKYRIKEEEAQSFSDFLVPMLEWYPNKRATAQKMLEHPWLNMNANYEYKYTEKEYEIMMLKKDMKMTAGKGARGQDDTQQEMNELIESDEEINAADLDDDRAFRNNQMSSDEDGMEGADDDQEYDYDADERSLVDSDTDRR